MNELTITKHNGGVYIDSREVAELIGKDHNHLLRDIRGYIKVITKVGASNFGHSDFFIESSYQSAQNKEMPCYLISKCGAEVIANKLTGEKGVLFTFAYVSKFNQMEQRERKREIKAYSRPRLSEFNTAVRNVLSGMSQANTTPDDVMKFLRGVYEPLGIAVAADAYSPCYYSVTFIADYFGIYSESGRPHGHAVAAIVSKLNIGEGQMVVIPYGLVGVTYRYDIDVLCAIGDWIVKNGFPREIPYLDFDYHIYYKSAESGRIADADSVNRCNDSDDEPEGYTAKELDAMCGKFGDCDDCPGFPYCCEVD